MNHARTIVHIDLVGAFITIIPIVVSSPCKDSRLVSWRVQACSVRDDERLHLATRTRSMRKWSRSVWGFPGRCHAQFSSGKG